ncbi:MAG: excinuclease ABC subunit UvrC, partial [Christensenellaceae bacterium]|nr:excinuclease ABC subunit UvrC [Christensenellaceae bacterium]
MLDAKQKLNALPTNSGVYVMLDDASQIIYIGKAKNLKTRVRQYFNPSSSKTEKTMILVEKIADVKYIITPTELDALILENNLIKEHKPKYNILLKDDKTYPYIKINTKSDFPSPEITRRLKPDGCKYFGPYMIGITATSILDLLQIAFPIRNCTGELKQSGKDKRECLNYHIGRCLAPCTGKIARDDYHLLIKKSMNFLNGDDKEVRQLLQDKMTTAASTQQFELAMQYRDALQTLDKLVRKQTINFP